MLHIVRFLKPSYDESIDMECWSAVVSDLKVEVESRVSEMSATISQYESELNQIKVLFMSFKDTHVTQRSAVATKQQADDQLQEVRHSHLAQTKALERQLQATRESLESDLGRVRSELHTVRSSDAVATDAFSKAEGLGNQARSELFVRDTKLWSSANLRNRLVGKNYSNFEQRQI